MADNSGASVAIVAIVAILIIVGGIVYFMTNGTFNFSKSTTVVQPTNVVTPSGGASTTPSPSGNKP